MLKLLKPILKVVSLKRERDREMEDEVLAQTRRPEMDDQEWLSETIREKMNDLFPGKRDWMLVEEIQKIGLPSYPCRLCGERISVPYYAAKEDEKEEEESTPIVHQVCGDLPMEMEEHILHHSGHTLCKTRNGYYKCSDCDEFVLSIKIALKLFPINHKCHPRHPLIPIHKSEEFHCDACSLVHEDGISYRCTTCPSFRVHQYCVSPRVVKLPSHRHTVRFAYSIPETQFGEPIYCHICRQHLKGQSLAYHCARCRYYFHIFDCRYFTPPSKKHYQELLWDNVSKQKKMGDLALSETIREKMNHLFPWARKWILVEEMQTAGLPAYLCRLCKEAISVPYYATTDKDVEDDEDKDLYGDGEKEEEEEEEEEGEGKNPTPIGHKVCGDLPMEMEHHLLHPGHTLRKTRRSDDSGLVCNCCKDDELSRGYVYYPCSDCEEFVLCIICALKLFPINHKCHQHPVIANHKREEFRCDACSMVDHEDQISYECTTCPSFRVNQHCVTPRTVKLPSHRHNVRFVNSLPETQFGEPIYCHICRLHLKGQSFAYHCARCRYYFHIFNCRSIQHFSHEDPLVPVEEEVVEEEKDGAHAESKSSKCGSCRLKISVPYYVSTGWHGMFLLHKFCAELPDRVQHHLHPGHELTLGNPFEGQMCDVCHDPWKGFSYSCFRGSCSFSIDIICALKNVHSQHKFHKHPLIASHTKGLFSCSACYIDSDGPSYKCTTCRFWVHYQCGSAPMSRKHDMHPHLLKLTYSIQESTREDGGKFHCHVCRDEMQPRDWAYHCAGCKYYIHARNCSEPPWSREIEEFDHEAALAAAVLLPPVAGESVSLATLFFMETNNGQNTDLKQAVDGIKAGKTLFLDPNETCHVCAALLAAPCNNCALCNYFLPKSPAELDDHDSLIRGYYSMLKASPNQTTCDGFGMSFGKDGLRMKISSSVLPRYVKHEGHRHVLLTAFITEKTWCSACEGDDVQGYAFRCNLCRFTIHTYCATFPGSIRHRYDKKHSFKLTYYFVEGVQEYLCEVCEGDITTMWFYHCAECDLSIHPRCIWRYFINFGPSIRLGFTNERLLVPTAKIGPINCPPCSEYKETSCRYSTVEFTDSYHIFMSHLECGGGLQNERWPVERKELVNVLALLRSEEEEDEEEYEEEEDLVNVPLFSSEE